MAQETPGFTKLNGYPDRALFTVEHLNSPKLRHVSEDDFIQASSSRGAVAQGHAMGCGRDASTASSLLMSESVYLPVANTSFSPEHLPPGIDSVMSRSTPLCTVGPQNNLDPVRPSRNCAMMDSLDMTTNIPELESSHATVRLSDQFRIAAGPLQASSSSSQVNR